MKAKIEHENETRLNPEFSKEKFYSLKGAERRLYLMRTPRIVKHKKGDIVDHPEAYQLVLCGQASPADDECKEVVGLDDGEIRKRITAYAKLAKGMSTGDKRYDISADDDETDDEFNELLEEDDDLVSTD